MKKCESILYLSESSVKEEIKDFNVHQLEGLISALGRIHSIVCIKHSIEKEKLRKK